MKIYPVLLLTLSAQFVGASEVGELDADMRAQAIEQIKQLPVMQNVAEDPGTIYQGPSETYEGRSVPAELFNFYTVVRGEDGQLISNCSSGTTENHSHPHSNAAPEQ